MTSSIYKTFLPPGFGDGNYIEGIDFYYKNFDELLKIEAKSKPKPKPSKGKYNSFRFKSIYDKMIFSPDELTSKSQIVSINSTIPRDSLRFYSKLYLFGCSDKEPEAIITPYQKDIIDAPIIVVRVCEIDERVGRPPLIECPTLTFDSVATLLDAVNDFYKRIGVSFQTSVDSIIDFNYDYDSDGPANNKFYVPTDGTPSNGEDEDLREVNAAFRETRESENQNFFPIYIVEDVVSGKPDTRGAALMREDNKAVVVEESMRVNSNTIIHELGHAVWRLFHPDHPEYRLDDRSNFMHSISGDKISSQVRIRAWQWITMKRQ